MLRSSWESVRSPRPPGSHAAGSAHPLVATGRGAGVALRRAVGGQASACGKKNNEGVRGSGRSPGSTGKAPPPITTDSAHCVAARGGAAHLLWPGRRCCAATGRASAPPDPLAALRGSAHLPWQPSGGRRACHRRGAGVAQQLGERPLPQTPWQPPPRAACLPQAAPPITCAAAASAANNEGVRGSGRSPGSAGKAPPPITADSAHCVALRRGGALATGGAPVLRSNWESVRSPRPPGSHAAGALTPPGSHAAGALTPWEIWGSRGAAKSAN